MSIEMIISKIVDDAVEYESKLISEADAEAKRIIAQAEAEAEVINQQMTEKIAKESSDIVTRKQAAADLEARKMRLVEKQRIIDAAIDEASSLLAEMKPKEYIELMTRRIVAIDMHEGRVLLNKKDRKKIGEKFIKAANSALGKGKLTLSDECINAKGGFVISNDVMDIDCTLETMVAAVKDAATPKLIELLFEE